jgi:hypothetical protein
LKSLKLTVTVKFEDWVAFQIPTLPENKDNETCREENSPDNASGDIKKHCWDLLGNEHAFLAFFLRILLFGKKVIIEIL